MANLGVVNREWEQYSRAIFNGINPSVVQYEQTKQAFYAGFWASMTVLMQISNEHSEQEAAGLLEDVRSECQEYHDRRIKEIQDKIRIRDQRRSR